MGMDKREKKKIKPLKPASSESETSASSASPSSTQSWSSDSLCDAKLAASVKNVLILDDEKDADRKFTFRVSLPSNPVKVEEQKVSITKNSNDSISKTTSLKKLKPIRRENEAEFELLSRDAAIKHGTHIAHDYNTAPLLTRCALKDTGMSKKEDEGQYGVLGEVLAIRSPEKSYTPDDSRLYMNTNAPLSVIVSGVQGSGKSHTVSTILENMFIPEDRRIGSLSKSLSGLVLHMSEGGLDSNPNEAAWIGASSDSNVNTPKVLVYVSPSSLNTMKKVYEPLGSAITVKPLYFTEEELDAQAFLSMMSVGNSDGAPLYMQIVLSILRELGEKYTFSLFKEQLDEKRKDFNPAQEAGLKQRMSLLESFLFKSRKDARHAATERFQAGQLTVVDLSDPFIDPSSASGIFDVVTRLFVRAQVNTGKVLLVDEAHKYLNAKNTLTGLTKSLLTLIREQRHKGMRVIISTQEPTVVPPVLIDLCSVAIMHRFSSPSWWHHITHHVSADFSSSDAFDQVVKLQTGEAIILAPSGLFTSESSEPLGGKIVTNFGRRYLHARIRKRITTDGGASVLVV